MRTKADKDNRGVLVYADVHIVALSAGFKNWQNRTDELCFQGWLFNITCCSVTAGPVVDSCRNTSGCQPDHSLHGSAALL